MHFLSRGQVSCWVLRGCAVAFGLTLLLARRVTVSNVHIVEYASSSSFLRLLHVPWLHDSSSLMFDVWGRMHSAVWVRHACCAACGCLRTHHWCLVRFSVCVHQFSSMPVSRNMFCCTRFCFWTRMQTVVSFAIVLAMLCLDKCVWSFETGHLSVNVGCNSCTENLFVRTCLWLALLINVSVWHSDVVLVEILGAALAPVSPCIVCLWWVLLLFCDRICVFCQSCELHSDPADSGQAARKQKIQTLSD